ncbi:YbeD family protein [Catenovulum sp. SM1970]|uniref:DUF493 family protein YbeD n=1 Tax=Marinifaba aquimaris TaxID=2741323 RepID=UPI0015727DA6|nr:DUF493 family protein YbeD [Marinifaba aquimaris]NTS78109.1 YbeD family protein [Marinifaba aquimaris]
MKTRFDEFLEFPCRFPFKVVGYTDPALIDEVVAVLQQHVPGDYSPTSKDSGKGTYQSITVDVNVESKEQVEKLYQALSEIEKVRMVL